jgi:hypothetical protein
MIQPSLPMMVAVAAALLATFIASTARSRPPANPDPSLAPWFQSLQQPDTGASCCSIADCRPTDFRMSGEDYEALIDGRWMLVPKEKVLQRTDNPIGRAVVCWTPEAGIMCFVRGAET